MKRFYEDYFTPMDVVGDIFKPPVDILKGVTSVLEPSAGEGNIVNALRYNGFDHHITAVELQDRYIPKLRLTRPDALINGDFLCMDKSILGTFDLVIINPPFSLVEEFVEHSLDLLNDGGQVIVLMRLVHLVGVQRGKFMRRNRPSNIYLMCHRPSFTGGQSDIGGYAWVRWSGDGSDQTYTDWIRPENVIPSKCVNNGALKKRRTEFNYG